MVLHFRAPRAASHRVVPDLPGASSRLLVSPSLPVIFNLAALILAGAGPLAPNSRAGRVNTPRRQLRPDGPFFLARRHASPHRRRTAAFAPSRALRPPVPQAASFRFRASEAPPRVRSSVASPRRSRRLQVLHKPLRDDLRHDLISVMDALAALVAQGEGERAGQCRRGRLA